VQKVYFMHSCLAAKLASRDVGLGRPSAPNSLQISTPNKLQSDNKG